jgi:tyrocidine synthetase-3
MEYTLPLAFHVEGNPDRNRFEEVFQILVKRHEGLRTSFGLIGEEPVREIYEYEDIEFTIEYYDPDSKFVEAPSAVEGAIKHFFRPFDISVPPLLRVGLIRLSGTEHLFLVNMHHLVSDGLSRGILAREFIRLYRGEELPEPPVRYRDFSEVAAAYAPPGSRR